MSTYKFTSNLQALLLRAASGDLPNGSPFGDRDGQPFVRFDGLRLSVVNGRPCLTLCFKGDEVITLEGEARGLTTTFEGVPGTIDFTLS